MEAGRKARRVARVCGALLIASLWAAPAGAQTCEDPALVECVKEIVDTDVQKPVQEILEKPGPVVEETLNKAKEVVDETTSAAGEVVNEGKAVVEETTGIDVDGVLPGSPAAPPGSEDPTTVTPGKPGPKRGTASKPETGRATRTGTRTRVEGARTSRAPQTPTLGLAEITAGTEANAVERVSATERDDSGRMITPAEALNHLAVPLVLMAAVVAYLIIQGRLDRGDPKLVLAPVHIDIDRLEFE